MAAKAKKRVVKKAKAKKKGPVILPRKMSSLIRIALKDIRKAEASVKFVVDMGDWYKPNQELVCAVNDTTVSKQTVCVACAAGSVMAFSLGLGADSGSKSDNMVNSGPNSNQLQAINSLRTGDVLEAARDLNFETDDDAKHEKYSDLETYIPDYDNLDPEPFHKAMEAFQAKLQKAGL